MQSLDPMTIERLAKLIVDRDGPFERAGWELERLLRRAGWADPPAYDGSYRVGWLLETINERTTDRRGEPSGSDLERLICRVCDPLEYEDGMESAEVFLSSVNEVLEREQLIVTYVGSRPVLSRVDTDGATPVFSAPADLEERIAALVTDPATAAFLVNRATETKICEANNAHTLAIVGIGSLIEGLLLAVLIERVEEIRKEGFAGRDRRFDASRVGLAVLIDTAYKHGFIQFDARDFMAPVREYRNFVHLRQQVAKGAQPDRDSVMMCWGPVRAILNDLEERILTSAPTATPAAQTR